MKYPKPNHYMESLFWSRAEKLLPIAEARIHRNVYALTIEWISPCVEIGSLWFNITPYEIILSCKISHAHFAQRDRRYVKEHLTKRHIKQRMIQDSVEEALNFLSNKVAVTISYKDGQAHSYGWGKVENIESSLQDYRRVFGEDIQRQVWTWSGEVK